MKGFFLCCLLPFWLHAQIHWNGELKDPFAVIISIDSQKVPLGKTIKLMAEFRYPDGFEIDNDQLLEHLTWAANPLFPPFKLEQWEITKMPKEKGIQEEKIEALLRPLSKGPLYLSFLNVNFKSSSENIKPYEFSIPSFTVEVTEAQTQKELSFAPFIPLTPQFPLGLTEANRRNLQDGPPRIEANEKEIQALLRRHSFPWLAIALLFGLGAIGWTGYITRDSWPQFAKKKSPPPLPPKELAEQALLALEQQNYLAQGMFKEHYSELSSILLDGLQAMLRMKTKEMTTDELAHVLKKTSLSDAQQQEIIQVLTEIDQVKFAKKTPTVNDALAMQDRIRNFFQL